MEEIERRRTERRYRTIKPLPTDLKRLRERAGAPKVVKFKGIAQELNGMPRSFLFYVLVSKRLLHTGRAMDFFVKSTIREMQNGKMPVHTRGQIFRDFVHDLYGSARWRKIDTLLEYDVDVPS
jgi:hypothetical protein